jgi:hypothetical protein
MSFFVLLLILAIYIIRPGDWLPGMDIGWNLILNGIGAVAFIIPLLEGKAAKAADRSWGYLLGFFLLMLTSSVVHGQFSTISYYTPQMLTNMLVFMLICTSLDSKTKLRFFVLVLFGLLLFIAWQCHLQIETGQNIAGEPPLYRKNRVTYPDGSEGILETPQAIWVGVFHDPNDVGLLLLTLLPLALARGFVMPNQQFLSRLSWIAVAGYLLHAIYLTNSRGTFVAALAAIGFFFIIRYRSTTGLVLALLSGFALLTLGPSRMSTLTSADDSAMERVYTWIEALEAFAMYPFFGVGPKHWLDFHHLTTHNSYVLAFVENGFFAYVCWLAVLLIALAAIVNVSLKSTDKALQTESAAIAACLIGVLASIFFISRTYILLPFLMAALTLTYARLQSPDAYLDAIKRLNPIILTAVAAASVVTVWITNRLTTMLML